MLSSDGVAKTRDLLRHVLKTSTTLASESDESCSVVLLEEPVINHGTNVQKVNKRRIQTVHTSLAAPGPSETVSDTDSAGAQRLFALPQQNKPKKYRSLKRKRDEIAAATSSETDAESSRRTQRRVNTGDSNRNTTKPPDAATSATNTAVTSSSRQGGGAAVAAPAAAGPAPSAAQVQRLEQLLAVCITTATILLLMCLTLYFSACRSVEG